MAAFLSAEGAELLDCDVSKLEKAYEWGLRAVNITWNHENALSGTNVENPDKGLTERGIKLVSGGTDNHLMLVDLTPFELTGKAVEKLLDSVNITCNKNTIPNDPKSPFVTSGVRLGTPAITSRGFTEADMDKVAECIAKMIKEGEAASEEVRAMVKELTDQHPL